MKPIQLTLTPDEVKVLLQFIDLGVKAVGIQSVNSAFILQQKLEKAVNEANAPEAPPSA